MRDVKFNKKCGTEIEVRFSIAFGIHAQKIHWIKYYLNCSDSILYVHHTIVYIDVYSLWIILNPVVFVVHLRETKIHIWVLGCFFPRREKFTLDLQSVNLMWRQDLNCIQMMWNQDAKKISKIDSLIVKWWQSLMILDRIFWIIFQILGKKIWFFVHDHWIYRMNSSEHLRGYYKMDSNLIARNTSEIGWTLNESTSIWSFKKVFLLPVLKCYQSHFEACILGSLDTGWNL